ncbi:DUF6064 family protein [Amorphus orientalis]|uniref:MFS transporter permease n=1 Tax=Amorphus orientalis TaxID=649198 RepID=A0AAE4AQF8_9HYPH|nr:DUF6064 family protein [Amorphus orientalis]MDQ0314036.1 hypothetical protein [Amorphus orientalis]
MGPWWTYRPQDFLLFSPSVYWRLFELANAALFPLPLIALVLGSVIVWLGMRGRPGAFAFVGALLSVGWALSAWQFLWVRYVPVNWAASYAVPAFLVEALLLLGLGFAGGSGRGDGSGRIASTAGAALAVGGLALYPLFAPLSGRPIAGAEVVGIAPDATAVFTLGVLCLWPRSRLVALAMVVPVAWCLASAATLLTMGTWQGWVPLAAAGAAVAARAWPAKN